MILQAREHAPLDVKALVMKPATRYDVEGRVWGRRRIVVRCFEGCHPVTAFKASLKGRDLPGTSRSEPDGGLNYRRSCGAHLPSLSTFCELFLALELEAPN